jgi:hypothetical protein
MGLRCQVELYMLLILFLTCVGCSEGATLIRETSTGGVVTYAFNEDRGGAFFSRYREDALKLVEKKCPSGYTIVTEGEARGHRSVSGVVEGTEDQTKHRRWGLQFRCKPT